MSPSNLWIIVRPPPTIKRMGSSRKSIAKSRRSSLQWVDLLDDGTRWELTDPTGDVLAQVDHAAIKTQEGSTVTLWRVIVFVPERFQLEGQGFPYALVNSQQIAKEVAERVLRATVLTEDSKMRPA